MDAKRTYTITYRKKHKCIVLLMCIYICLLFKEVSVGQ